VIWRRVLPWTGRSLKNANEGDQMDLLAITHRPHIKIHHK
jgi:hypothetical protein